ncbi:uncharacterized protein LOC119374450 [Rhipicephalus sanguineus]|uniref:uncharacterized protein LOC119374450 n=1 Tax=Rhipicephalus sanguineus TaxID=34632 RepID=UPI001895247D|nr:uncharacterized protein LOC119374450 [Rhipicephalus sanguineus]
MDEKQLLAILVSVACIAISECKWPFFRKDPNIRKFLKTAEEIWTYATNEMTAIECKVDVKESMTTKSMAFKRSYIYNRRKKSFRLLGLFDAKRSDIMVIKPSGDFPKQIEEILFMSRTHKCAVIKVTTFFGGSSKKYDLRVLNSSVEEGPDRKCVEHFYNVAGRGHKLYENKCQRLFRNIYNIP